MFVLQPVLITASTHTDILVAFYVLYHHVFHLVLIDVQLQTAVWWKFSISCTVKLLVTNVVIWQLLTLVHIPLNVINTTETGIYASVFNLYVLFREMHWSTRHNTLIPVWTWHTISKFVFNFAQIYNLLYNGAISKYVVRKHLCGSIIQWWFSYLYCALCCACLYSSSSLWTY
jgi:hypothetical protein